MKIPVKQVTKSVRVAVVTRSVEVRQQFSNIVLQQPLASVTIRRSINNVAVRQPIANVEVNQVGRRGPTGKDGRIQEITAGPGIIVDSSDPAQPIISATGGSGDKNFVYDFTMQHTLNIQHDLQKYPSATVLNSAGDKVESTVQYIDINNVIIQFTAPFSGRVTLN